MSVAIERDAANSPTKPRPSAAAPQAARRNARRWIIAGLLPLTALGFVPLVDQLVSTSGGAGDTGAIGFGTGIATAVPWNASLCILLATLVVVTATDLAERRIPNYLMYPALLWLIGLSIVAGILQPVANAAEPLSWIERSLVGTLPLGETLAGALACFSIMCFVFIMAGTGGGDVKLCAIIGAALGLELGLTAVVCSHIAAGAAALSWALLVYGPVRTFGTFGRIVGSFLLPLWIAPPKQTEEKWTKFPIPMSPFFLIGTVFTLWMPR